MPTLKVLQYGLSLPEAVSNNDKSLTLKKVFSIRAKQMEAGQVDYQDYKRCLELMAYAMQ